MIPAYLAIGQALAADDIGATTQGIANLHQVVSAINPQSLGGNAAERWTVEQSSLSTISARMSQASDLAAMRSAFALLSDELLALHRTFGFSTSNQLFELHCPMAFDGRGASWIQR